MNYIHWAKLLAAFSSLSAGISIVGTRLILPETDPQSMAAIRFGIGALCLMPFLVVGFCKNPIAPTDWPPVIFLGALFFGLFTFLFNASLALTTAAHGAVGLATSPIITLVLAWVLGREGMTKMKMICVVLAFLGVAVAVSDSLVATASGTDILIGDSLMLLAALTVSIYTIYAKPYIMKYGGIYFTAVVMAIGVIALIAASPLVGFPIQVPDFTNAEWGVMLFLGVIGAAVQFAAFIWALGRIPPSTVGITLTLTPISAFIFAWPVLGEVISYQALVGLLFVVTAIIIMNRQPQ
ncbi:MAG: DMT family transporter [Rhodospirillales bacterium]|nr:DMT family transporter [Rhodospirillales bacterium]